MQIKNKKYKIKKEIKYFFQNNFRKDNKQIKIVYYIVYQ